MYVDEWFYRFSLVHVTGVVDWIGSTLGGTGDIGGAKLVGAIDDSDHFFL